MSPDSVVQWTWGLWLISWFAAAAWSSRTTGRPNAVGEKLYRVLTAAGAILLFGHPNWRWVAATLWRLGSAAQWTLVAVTMCGLAFTWWARIVLGRLWSSGVTRKVDHEVIMAGPYRFVRHPIYSGIILSLLATAALLGTTAGLLGAALIVLGTFMKARVEENFLRRELGEDRYDAYARRVPMFVPFTRDIHQKI
jgi:protein-S-isoprenylcysteine O-methyltransferase Ste14